MNNPATLLTQADSRRLTNELIRHLCESGASNNYTPLAQAFKAAIEKPVREILTDTLKQAFWTGDSRTTLASEVLRIFREELKAATSTKEAA